MARKTGSIDARPPRPLHAPVMSTRDNELTRSAVRDLLGIVRALYGWHELCGSAGLGDVFTTAKRRALTSAGATSEKDERRRARLRRG